MAFSRNEITIVGRLGKDAETRFTTNNVAITNFSVVTEYDYKKGDNWEKETTWHNVTCFNLSDWFRERLVKGAQVFFTGRLTKREYTDKEGIKRYSTDIVMENRSLIIFSPSNESSHSGEKHNEPDYNDDQNSDLPF